MEIEIRSCDDWVAIYKDGERVWQNHSCSIREGLEALGIVFQDVDLYDKVDDCSSLPDGSDPFPERLP